MTKKKSRIKALLISSPKGMDYLQPIINEVITGIDTEIQLDLYTQSDRNLVVHSRQIEKDFVGIISLSDLIIVDLGFASPTTFFEIGIARAIGKSIVFITEQMFLDELPDLIKQSYFIVYKEKKDLFKVLKSFFTEYLENPKRFASRSILGQDTSSQIVVDLEKLEQHDFENLCFELLSRLGYKQLEWKMKNEFADAVTTLRKQDPDGFEYNEIWLISFRKEFQNGKMIEIALHDPEYFVERVYRDFFDNDLFSNNKITQARNDVPITLLFIFRGKENFPKKLIREISNRDFRMNKRGYPFTIRIRWWDEPIITSLVQKNLPLALKYFSTEAITRSSTRLSYEELYKLYADNNEQLETANKLLISEKNKNESLERDAAWKLLAFITAHKLGNPIDAIDSELSNLKLAIEQGKKDSLKDIVSSMDLPIEKAKLIVSEFRSLSTSQEIKPELITQEKLNELIKYSTKPAVDKNVKVTFDLKKLPNIMADGQKLSDCFSELVRNSLHFILNEDEQVKKNDDLVSNRLPEIKVSTELAKLADLPEKIDKTKKYIKIVFADNGCGVPFEKKALIFRAFETSYIHGTGLGLAICESIIEKHGGKIRENGKPKDGATFEIFLPII